jgi:hypothetical protein
MEIENMKKVMLLGLCLFIFLTANPAWAQSGGHASVGLGHGEEGYLHLEEMVKHLEFSLKMQDTSEELKTHGPLALQHSKEALKHYNEALKHGSEALGRPVGMPMAEGSGEERVPRPQEEGSSHSHDEGSH